MPNHPTRVASAVFLVVLSACVAEVGSLEPDTESDEIALQVSAGRVSMSVGETVSLNVSVSTSSAARLYTIAYRSSNSAVATVSNDGVVNALASGETTINVVATLIDNGGTASASVVVAVGGTTGMTPTNLTLPSTGTRAVATFESIGIYWTPGKDPGAAGCKLQYRRSIDSTWLDGLALWYDARNSECRGSLVHLTPGTSYDIQLTLPGEAPSRQLRISTWSNNVPVAQTVRLPAGTSQQTLTITQGGSASGYVLYTTDASTPSVIDVANGKTFNVRVSASYVIIRGLTLRGAQQDAIRLDEGVHDVIIEDNDISGWGRSSGKQSTQGYTIGANMDSAVRAVCFSANLSRVVIQRNRIHHPRYGSNSWTEGHPLGPQGIAFDGCGGNHVFRYNELYSSMQHYFNDGMGGCCNFSTIGFPNSDSDIYGNIIKNVWDDAIEAEGANRNVRIWGNYMDQTATAVATTATSIGPVYIFRNVYNRSRMLEGSSLDQDQRNVFAKSGGSSTDGRRYLFHNTMLQATQSGLTYSLGGGSAVGSAGRSINNTVSRNNIFQNWKTWWSTFDGTGSGNDYGYDLYNASLGGPTETNGIRGVPTYASGHGWTSEAGGRYQLASTSLGYDAGIRIPNFNTGFSGSAPDIGAHEAGTAAMVFGVTGQ